MSEARATRSRTASLRKATRVRASAPAATAHRAEAPAIAPPQDGRIRAVIENVSPAVDCGRFPIKRVLGEAVAVEADCFTDGHDALICILRWRHAAESDWRENRMQALTNDRWSAQFQCSRMGCYLYTVVAWVDAFLSWRHDFSRRIEADDIRSQTSRQRIPSPPAPLPEGEGSRPSLSRRERDRG
jgi:hypothetical protein